MRADMSRVIVERPRRGGFHRRGRAVPLEDLPHHEGMRRPHVLSGGEKSLNENLAPLRRYLERQPQPPMALRQIDPLIRELTLYRDHINRITKET